MKADITAKIWLYFSLHRIIKIKVHTSRYPHSSAVYNELKIIPAYFLSAHALSVGRELVCVLGPRVLVGAPGGGIAAKQMDDEARDAFILTSPGWPAIRL